MKNSSRTWRRAGVLAAAGASLVFLVAGSLWLFVSLGRWFQFSEEPQSSDLIVILCGDPSRAIKAAELYRQGYAPEVWVGRAFREAYFARLDKVGIVLPKEEEIFKTALIKRGVPPSKVRFYGQDNLSTIEEAQALRRALGRGDARMLLVTSRTHTRRSKMIFREVFPAARIRAISASDGSPQLRWWESKFLAEAIAKELMCTIYFELGGRLLNHHP